MGTAAYVPLLLLLRVSSKRTLAKLSAFDFVVTIALGSTLATVLLSKSVALAEGVAAIVLENDGTISVLSAAPRSPVA